MTSTSNKSIRKEMLNILERALLPLSIDEIFNQIYEKYLPKDAVDPAKTYSPHRRYTVGDRLFHPHRKFQNWFTVAELVSNTRFWAHFDDGRKRELDQGRKEVGMFPWAPEIMHQRIRKMIKNCARSCDKVVEVAGLYVHHTISAKIPFDRLSTPRALANLARLRMKSRNLNREDELQKLCSQCGLSSLYYLAPCANVISILENGILANNLAPPDRVSFADDEIQAKRHKRYPSDTLRLTLHDYVPVFFAPKPPLLYSLGEKQQDLAYFLIDPKILLEPGVVFAPVNAVSNTEFYSDISDLEHLNWDVLQARYWKSDDKEQHRRNKLHRQAEAEIPVTIPIQKIKAIVVYDDEHPHLLQEEIQARNLRIRVVKDRSLYC